MRAKERQQIEKQKTEQYTEKDVFNKAEELFKPIYTNERLASKKLFANVASIISITAIGATILLYQFNTGYSKVYNIPTNMISLSLERYIPCCIQFISILHILLFYTAETKKDKLFHRNWLNPLRLIYGTIVLFKIIEYNKINRYFPRWICVGTSFLIPLLLEIISYYRKKSKKGEKQYTEDIYKMKVEDHIHNWFIYNTFIKSGLVFFVIALIIVPYMGMISGRVKTEYQICTINNQTYAVIVDNNEKCLIQLASINNKELAISTESY